MDGYIFCTLFFVAMACAYDQCPFGYWGENCGSSCPYHCKYSLSDGRGLGDVCDRTDGRCRQGCMPGYWGDYCGIPCPTNCLKECTSGLNSIYSSLHLYKSPNYSISASGCVRTCRPDDGTCYDCEDDHYYSHYCNVSCRELNPYCETCPQDGRTCDICDDGVPEDSCRKSCPTNCDFCDQDRNHCYLCLAGYWGTDCLATCDGNCFYCDRLDGECHRCKDGYWGQNCSLACTHEHSNCLRCNKIYGICEECIDGLWGPECQNPCSPNCADVRCEKTTGLCVLCKPPYWGASCNISCITGDCEDISTCAQMEGPVCFKCRKGTWGEKCSLNCSHDCFGGCNIDTGECYTADIPARASEESLSLNILIVITVSVGSSLMISLAVAVLPNILKCLKLRWRKVQVKSVNQQ